MATLQDYRDERLRKLETLKGLGVNPYPADTHRTHDAGEIVPAFETIEGQRVTVAGRIMSLRKFGKLAFIGRKGRDLFDVLVKNNDRDFIGAVGGFDNRAGGFVLLGTGHVL